MSSFDPFYDIFPLIVDWPKRLAHEAPFYRKLIDRLHAREALDVACGTGHHGALLASWGLSVEAADLNPDMLQQARAVHAGVGDLRFVQRGYDRPVDRPGSYDLAICVGNSLALAPSFDIAAAAVGQMLAAVRPGGMAMVHVLNLWTLPDGPCTWQKSLRASTAEGDAIVIKGVHRAGQRGFVDLLVAPLATTPPRLRAQSAEFLGLTADWLRQVATSAGAADVEFFGGYHDQAYVADRSVDLIMVATR